MQLFCESPTLKEYLREDAIIDYSHPLIQETLHHFPTSDDSEIERIRKTYEFVRDGIHHSGDIQSQRMTCAASEVLIHREGFCYAKSHLLAALLRAQHIPTGLCYQRLLFGSTPAEGYVLHGLNAVYLTSEARWIRLDARGNRPGIQAEFSTEKEQLAFVVQPVLGEIDYPTVYVQAHPAIIAALQGNANDLNSSERFWPDQLSA